MSKTLDWVIKNMEFCYLCSRPEHEPTDHKYVPEVFAGSFEKISLAMEDADEAFRRDAAQILRKERVRTHAALQVEYSLHNTTMGSAL